MALDTQDRIYIEQRVTNDAPSPLVAYLLWFFLGIISAHRFYLGKWGTALLQIASYFLLIGFVWWLLDAFLISLIIKQRQDRIREHVAEGLAV
ncbi:TM2 domain-containing protein [Aquisalinus flavus]|uniref:TM2 domain-containing protein n=1 Tax=Aquisalinus flavus TaxID=1526572 RepID=A0A8J2V3X4_9PROT|nr:TM2 domain-containing protein [Aquisalinus flavus]MBD0426805.1 TM2 domain-containing protein [Aquisalinus flavus]UNE46654.1 TM2 domain-containing protein [Aquisalinus flavus]GGC96148.1 hypothetical protein GCM10011342_01180 [Aquisalinus flavus]